MDPFWVLQKKKKGRHENLRLISYYMLLFTLHLFRAARLRCGPNQSESIRSVIWDIWRLGHLAVGTFGGRDIWQSGPKRSQMGCWDMGQMAVGTFDGQEICYKGPNGC